jgi:hypothetical protein
MLKNLKCGTFRCTLCGVLRVSSGFHVIVAGESERLMQGKRDGVANANDHNAQVGSEARGDYVLEAGSSAAAPATAEPIQVVEAAPVHPAQPPQEATRPATGGGAAAEAPFSDCAQVTPVAAVSREDSEAPAVSTPDREDALQQADPTFAALDADPEMKTLGFLGA